MAICSGSLMFQKSFKYWEHNTSSSPLLLGLMAVRDDIWTQMSLSSEEYNLKKTKGMWLQRVSYSFIFEHCFTESELRGGEMYPLLREQKCDFHHHVIQPFWLLYSPNPKFNNKHFMICCWMILWQLDTSNSVQSGDEITDIIKHYFLAGGKCHWTIL